uniref:hypothetical protein n=1 Tax=Agathobacter sp. TaxID=2021311 RepID=UPI004055A65E
MGLSCSYGEKAAERMANIRLITKLKRERMKLKFTFDTKYSLEELEFLKKHKCEIISELKLAKVGFEEVPKRMIKYNGTYLAEIQEEDEMYWAALGKSRKGESVFASCYSDLPSMAEGI